MWPWQCLETAGADGAAGLGSRIKFKLLWPSPGSVPCLKDTQDPPSYFPPHPLPTLFLTTPLA